MSRHECHHGWDWRYGGACSDCSDDARRDLQEQADNEGRWLAENDALRRERDALRAALEQAREHVYHIQDFNGGCDPECLGCVAVKVIDAALGRRT